MINEGWEIKCETCQATGQVDHTFISPADKKEKTTKKRCNDCNGKGLILTEKGKQLIDFVNFWNDDMRNRLESLESDVCSLERRVD